MSEARTTWRRTELEPRDIACDLCGEQADTVHLTPWVTRCEAVLFACPRHDAGGYWFDLGECFVENVSTSPRAHHIFDHIRGKRGGDHAVSLLFDRFAAIRRDLAELDAITAPWIQSGIAERVALPSGERGIRFTDMGQVDR